MQKRFNPPTSDIIGKLSCIEITLIEYLHVYILLFGKNIWSLKIALFVLTCTNPFQPSVVFHIETSHLFCRSYYLFSSHHSDKSAFHFVNPSSIYSLITDERVLYAARSDCLAQSMLTEHVLIFPKQFQTINYCISVHSVFFVIDLHFIHWLLVGEMVSFKGSVLGFFIWTILFSYIVLDYNCFWFRRCECFDLRSFYVCSYISFYSKISHVVSRFLQATRTFVLPF